MITKHNIVKVKKPEIEYEEIETIPWIVKASFVSLHLPVLVCANLEWEFPGATEARTIIGGKVMKKCTVGVKSVLFFFDSLLRIVTSMFCCEKNIINEVSFETHRKIFAIRTLGAVSNVIQSIGMVLTGGDIFAVMRQARIPIVAVLRYFTLRESLTYEEINYLWITMCAALSFVLCKDLGADDFGLGMVLLVIALFMRTLYYVLTEVFLKKELAKFSVCEKQTLVGVHDVIGYFIVLWIEIWVEARSWNPMVGFFLNPAMSLAVLANFAQNWLAIVITFWFDSMLLQLMNTLGSGFTWLAKLTYKPEEWKPVKVPILFVLMSAVFAFTRLSNQQKNKKKITILKTNRTR